jgi:peptide/nickel transport system ATP-binding protein
MTEPILEVKNLRTYFYLDEGVVRAVDGVSFNVAPGEALGIVGESGSGKSITAASLMRLLEEPGRIVGGEIHFRGKNVVAMSGDEIRSLRGGSIAMVFQDPMTSLNPVLRIAGQMAEAMVVHGRYTQKAATDRAVDLLNRMGINEPSRAIRNYPHQFSGGMRQRVMLAMGFSNDPSLLIADEPTTALDVTIQAQILDLLRELNTEFGTSIILISHDLGVVANLCSRVIVMYGGEIVEEGPTEELLSNPKHPYTWALINAVPRLDRAGQKRLIVIEGSPPDPMHFPPGCRFAPRCPFRQEICDQHPELLPIDADRNSRCWVTQAGGELILNNGSHAAEGVAAPRSDLRSVSDKSEDAVYDGPMLELVNIRKHFPLQREGLFGGKREVVHAVDGVSFTVDRGETVGLVGESGSGKSTLARVIVRLYEPTSGELRFEGKDISSLKASEMRPLRRRMQMIFQDPYASLNPRMTVGGIIGEPLRVHQITPNEQATQDRIKELLSMVGLSPRAADQFPHEFSGGQRQRIGIARALAMDPRLIVADEPVSSLDVNIQAQIINLLEDLRTQLHLTTLFIAHDLSVVRHTSDRIVVLYLGKVMEIASKKDLFEQPLHPYTKSLLSSVPIPDVKVERERERILLTGEIPSPVHPPSGCRFRTRCPIAQAVCAEEEPALLEHRPGQWAACHFPGQL